jgi:hypothetical protein
MLDSLKAKGFQVEFLSHAQAILSVDFPAACLLPRTTKSLNC